LAASFQSGSDSHAFPVLKNCLVARRKIIEKEAVFRALRRFQGSGRMSTKLERLQVLRAIAALAVIVFHVIENHVAAGSLLRAGGLFAILASGVDLFFVISGFVIRYVTYHRHGPGEVVSFVLRRCLRVVPLYWIITCFVIAVAYFAPSMMRSYRFEPVHAALSMMFIPWPRPDGSFFPPLGPGWSINYEVMFYLTFALVMLRCSRGVLPYVLAGGYACVVLLVAVLDLNPQQFIFGNLRTLEFVAGVFLADAWITQRAWFRPAVAAMVLPVALFSIAVGFFRGPEVTIFSVAGFCLFTWGLLALPAMRVPERAGRFVTLLGDASYSLYLVHPIIISGLAYVWRAGFGRSGLTVTDACVFVVASVLGGLAVHFVLEKPLMRASKSLLSGSDSMPSLVAKRAG
jgi:exopolysaccharide production protein ExoZ